MHQAKNSGAISWYLIWKYLGVKLTHLADVSLCTKQCVGPGVLTGTPTKH